MSALSDFFSCYLSLLVGVTLFHLCLSNQNLDDVLCIKEERQALLWFKHRIIDEGDRLASWVDESNDCCKWAGIVCDNVTGHVHQIHLRALDSQCIYRDTRKELEEASKQKLKGDLSPSLLDLKQLKHLDLSCNDFRSIQVPKFISSLGNLRYLNLSSSNFSGFIPPQLGNLSELHTLCLGSFNGHQWADTRTSVMNMEWLLNLHLLHHLDMSYVDVSKAIDWFQVINTLPSLAELHLKQSLLLDVHPHVPCQNITSLLLLDLSNNGFINSLMPQWIFSIKSLVSLDLSMCNFNGRIPGSFAYGFRNLTSLKWLDVSWNNFMNSSLVLKELSSGIGSNLLSLDISGRDISSTTLDSLHNLTSLLSLGLSGNQLTNIIPRSLGNLCNLRDIYLSENDFQNISLTYLLESFLECKSPCLESLSASYSGLSGLLPDQLGKFKHMEYLEFRYNDISGTITDSIGRLSSLEVLDLTGNQLNGSLPDLIGRFSLLKSLLLSYDQFDGNLPNSLGQLSKLEKLDFSSNFLRGVATETHFAKLARLKYLTGDGNNLILRPRLANWIPPFQLVSLNLHTWGLGPQFPPWLQLQKDLVNLNISNTNISSPIPESFWKSLPYLKFLDISKNQMQGTLTLSGISTTLELLDLSSNRLGGKLPDVSNGSPRLLDLSNNLFVGSLHHFLCSDGVKATHMLNIGNNSLSGVIPECWKKWRRLSFLNLENNNFSGGIPRTLGRARHIQSLNMHGNKLVAASLVNLKYLTLELSGNELDGSIPSWIGTEISSLQLLNLRYNNFVGNIPHKLCYLSHIRILDLSNNKLMGDIPRCFNNFSVLSGKISVPDYDFLMGTGIGTK
ncbi:leucine-rich repeat protein [Tanacetum coccineum]